MQMLCAFEQVGFAPRGLPTRLPSMPRRRGDERGEELAWGSLAPLENACVAVWLAVLIMASMSACRPACCTKFPPLGL